MGILKLIIGLELPIQADEAYWWSLSRRLDFSYFDQGPLAPFHIFLFTSIFGDTFLALKLAAIVITSLGNLLVYLLAEELGMGRRRAWIAMILSILLPGFFLGSFVIVHDSSFIPLWTSALYFSTLYLKRNKPIYLLLFFICLGLGALSKHLMIFFVFGVLIWFLLTPEKWFILKKIELYLGIFITTLIISPMIYWNYQRDWVGFELLLGLKYAGGGSRSGDTIVFLVGQVLAFSPIIFLIFIILPFKSGMKKFMGDLEDPIWKFIFINSCILPLSLLFISIKTTIQTNWAFGSYPAMILISLYFLSKLSNKKCEILLVSFGISAAIFLIGIFFFFDEFRSYLPNQNKYQLLHRNYGYKDAIQEIENNRVRIDPSAELLANTYQDASRASWYLEGHPFIYSLNLFKRNQYTLWEQPKADKNYIVFHISDNPCVKPDFLSFYLKNVCNSLIEYPEKNIAYKGRITKRYRFWYCKKLENHWNEYFTNIYYEESYKKLLDRIKNNEPIVGTNSLSGVNISELIEYSSEFCK